MVFNASPLPRMFVLAAQNFVFPFVLLFLAVLDNESAGILSSC